MIEVTCENCGKAFQRRHYQLAASKHHFCGQACYQEWKQLPSHNPHWRGGKTSLICKECGETFHLHPSEIAFGEGTYCSRKCHASARTRRTGPANNAWKGGKITLTCIDCGKVRQHDPCIVARLKQTSRCAGCDTRYRFSAEANRGPNNPQWNGGKVQRVCQSCGKLFHVKQNVVRAGGGLYCCIACRSMAWRGSGNPAWAGGYGQIPYGLAWPAIRNQVRARDNHTCQLCGIAEEEIDSELSVHHIRPFRESKDNSPENLICLCENHGGSGCHKHCEHHPEDCPVPRKHWLLTA